MTESSRTNRPFLISLIVVLAFTAVGCYTVVRHPTAEPVALPGSAGGSVGDAACADCHYESEWLGLFDHPLVYGSSGYYAYDWWYDYYQRPWWYDDYWYYEDGGADGLTGGPSSWSKRKLRRGEEPTGSRAAVEVPATRAGSNGGNIQSSGASGAANSNEDDKPARDTNRSSFEKKKRNPR